MLIVEKLLHTQCGIIKHSPLCMQRAFLMAYNVRVDCIDHDIVGLAKLQPEKW